VYGPVGTDSVLRVILTYISFFKFNIQKVKHVSSA